MRDRSSPPPWSAAACPRTSTTSASGWRSCTRIIRPKDSPCRGSASSTEMAPSIKALLRPRAIALVGVSAKGGTGARILESNERFGFAVPTWPVNPNYAEISGKRCYRSLKELPEVPDCVVISVPAEAVIDVVGEAAAVGIRAAFIISEGFADAANDAGRERQARLVKLARQA